MCQTTNAGLPKRTPKKALEELRGWIPFLEYSSDDNLEPLFPTEEQATAAVVPDGYSRLHRLRRYAAREPIQTGGPTVEPFNRGFEAEHIRSTS